MSSDWQAHPDESLELLLRNQSSELIRQALDHPRFHADPYARLRIVDHLRQLHPDSLEIEQLWMQLMLLSNRPSPVWDALQQLMENCELTEDRLLLAAQVAQVMGKRDTARALYQRRISQHPADVDALQKYIEFEDPKLRSPQIPAQIEAQLTQPTSNYAREKLLFSLSTYFLPKDPPKAFRLATAAQRLKRGRLPNWHASELAARLQTDKSRELMGASDPGEPPELLFIVGLPRSGTTLLGSMLGAHSKMSNVGEQNLIPSLAYGPLARTAGPVAARVTQFVNHWYRAATGDILGSKATTVDKLPANIEHCGLILSCLPRSAIIHIRRNPLDCAVSIHLRDFDFGCSYATSAADIARYHALTDAHIAYWRSKAPDRVVSLDMEDLIETPQTSLGKLLEKFGFQWEPQMLDYWKKSRSTATFSESQVRRPLNRDGLGLREKIGDAGTEFTTAYIQAADKVTSA